LLNAEYAMLHALLALKMQAEGPTGGALSGRQLC
jgi:hypothetical protein